MEGSQQFILCQKEYMYIVMYTFINSYKIM